MAYIGRQPTIGNYVKCSDLTADGSTTTFNLTSSTTGLAVVPGSANNMIVSVSGVIQNPGTAYTVADSQITFTTAPGISDTIDFIVILGDALAIGEPSDNTVTNAKIVDGTIQNAKLANNSITINGTSINLGASGTIVAGTDWQSVITADGSTATTAVAGSGYFIDTTSNAHTINLPASPTQGDEVTIVDYAGTFNTNNVTVGRNGSNIDGAALDAILATNKLSVRFVYIDSTRGWKAIFDDNPNYGPAFVSATGGTVTTTGDYKIHTFTGDGCFVVLDGGNASGSNKVDYLVIAGGGSGGRANGGGGGGGAGGFRESHSVPVSGCYTASPLASSTSFPISATTYSITVGGGGAGSPGGSEGPGANGSDSIFSTITSTGGGYGGGPIQNGGPGGSGGGAGKHNATGGSGNTPSVSPSQGNPGGSLLSVPGGNEGGGGGGAGDQGETIPTGNTRGGSGGIGVSTSISGSATDYAGGGGANSEVGTTISGGTGGFHSTGATPSPLGSPSPGTPGYGGGNGSTGQDASQTGLGSGTANTGGGGGGIDTPAPGVASGSGGSGIVIIRYKFQ